MSISHYVAEGVLGLSMMYAGKEEKDITEGFRKVLDAAHDLAVEKYSGIIGDEVRVISDELHDTIVQAKGGL